MMVVLALIHVATVFGIVFSLLEVRALRQSFDLKAEQKRDPFMGTIGVLFSTEHGDENLIRRQKRTVRIIAVTCILMWVSIGLIRHTLSSAPSDATTGSETR